MSTSYYLDQLQPVVPDVTVLLANNGNEIGQRTTEAAVRDILFAIGEDPDRDGLLKTPERVARMYNEITAGYNTDPVKLINGALFDVDYSEMVIVKDIEFYSLCEHHMLPFFGKAHVAYIPSHKVLGLSKIPRIVEMFARRLQVQERMTTQIADFIEELLQPQGVAVVVDGSHLCGMMRGVKKADASMTTTTLRGLFRTDQNQKEDFLRHIARS
ncbi:MAG: GTP cyclohydrolase I FolE [Anaerolineae bacterium]|nr:GTP cyclohydrolase I FolE [Anaerolineae bacterium]